MRYRRYSKPQVRTITVKYAGKCACCGAEIKAGAIADYYPVGTIASMDKPQIAHVGGLDGNSATCATNIRNRLDPGFVDLDRMYEEQCEEACGLRWEK
jgi:hypothetical protein